MKKMLFASAFVLFGTFAMANEKSEYPSETRTETIVEYFGCVVSSTVITFDGCGTIISKSTSVYESNDKGCEGIVMQTNRVYTDLPCKANDSTVETIIREF